MKTKNSMVWRFIVLVFYRLIILLFFSFAIRLHAAGETAVNFLRIGTSARGSALADALIADASSAAAVFYNPAAVSRLEKREIQLMHIDLYADIDYESAVFAGGSGNYNFSVNVNYLHTSIPGTVIDKTNPYQFRSTGDYSFEDRCAGISIARRGGFLGFRLKYIEERIEIEKANTFAADFGILVPGRISFGFSALNIGPQMKFIKEKEELPQTYNFGLKFDLGNLDIFASASAYPDRKMSLRAAAELTVFDFLAARAGYQEIPEWNGDFSPFTFGAGIVIRNFGFDYAVLPSEKLGSSQKFSLWMRF
ncbi:MAG: PorV/PorQ family protein [Elusimicrobia bacterium]|nr:PorV/PorQ family protein [Elusimicrobiota bacterium]